MGEDNARAQAPPGQSVEMAVVGSLNTLIKRGINLVARGGGMIPNDHSHDCESHPSVFASPLRAPS